MPTQAQLLSGNYKKWHIDVDGFDIAIENRAGSIRKGTDKYGKSWSSEMKHHYGYFEGSKGADSDEVDCFVNPGYTSGKDIYIINQKKADGSFDEVKVMMGFDSEQDAIDAYHSNYEAGWQGFSGIKKHSIDSFKEWVFDRDKSTKLAESFRKNTMSKFENLLKKLEDGAAASASDLGTIPTSNRSDVPKRKPEDESLFRKKSTNGKIIKVKYTRRPKMKKAIRARIARSMKRSVAAKHSVKKSSRLRKWLKSMRLRKSRNLT